MPKQGQEKSVKPLPSDIKNDVKRMDCDPQLQHREKDSNTSRITTNRIPNGKDDSKDSSGFSEILSSNQSNEINSEFLTFDKKKSKIMKPVKIESLSKATCSSIDALALDPVNNDTCFQMKLEDPWLLRDDLNPWEPRSMQERVQLMSPKNKSINNTSNFTKQRGSYDDSVHKRGTLLISFESNSKMFDQKDGPRSLSPCPRSQFNHSISPIMNSLSLSGETNNSTKRRSLCAELPLSAQRLNEPITKTMISTSDKNLKRKDNKNTTLLETRCQSKKYNFR